MIKDILLLGNEQLYKVSEEVKENELDALKEIIQDLHDTLIDFREIYQNFYSMNTTTLMEFWQL